MTRQHDAQLGALNPADHPFIHQQQQEWVRKAKTQTETSIQLPKRWTTQLPAPLLHVLPPSSSLHCCDVFVHGQTISGLRRFVQGTGDGAMKSWKIKSRKFESPNRATTFSTSAIGRETTALSLFWETSWTCSRIRHRSLGSARKVNQLSGEKDQQHQQGNWKREERVRKAKQTRTRERVCVRREKDWL